MNILSYVKNKKESFAQSPFNRADALVLSWLAYFSYPEYLKEQSAALKNLEERGLLPDNLMYAETFNPKTSKKLFTAMCNSTRFKDIELSAYRDERDEEQEKQFAAVCINIYGEEYFLAFRGTDPSFTGWKEDFNLAIRYPVPSQQAAAEYARTQMLKYPHGRLRLGGHSKGGNLAVYAAITAEAEQQSAIIAVYNFDGPGFINDVYSEQGYKNVADRIFKIVPDASFVGMVLETHSCFSIVKSRNISVLQHDPFSWIISADDFKYLKCRTHGSVRLEQAFNVWIKELPLDERERVIGLVYAALNTLDTKNFNVFFKTLYRQLPALYREYRRLSADDKNFFNAKIKRLQKLLVNK